MKSLYEQHLATLEARTQQALEQCGYDYLIIGSGQSELRFLDDYYFPFKPNPHFAQWVPLQDKQNCWLLVRPNEKTKLFYYQPQDFWHLVETLPEAEWTTLLDIQVFDKNTELDNGLANLEGKGALVCPPSVGAETWGCDENPSALLDFLHFKRAYKTQWEQENLRKANQLAVLGHNTAKAAFYDGQSEFQIHQCYLSAIQQCEKHLPYGNIVALNEHGSILHYQYQEVAKPNVSLSLLLDAGATYNGYAADITRTTTASGTLFADLVEAVDSAQLALISTIKAGVDYVELHRNMQHRLAEILERFNIVNLDADAQLETSIIGTFFPHGLGHLLGLQVHDIGGHQQTLDGATKAPPEDSPALRLTRELGGDMVLTIEPGLYFIDSLLGSLCQSDDGQYVNWALIEELRPYGGIRIEDNVVVTADGSENLTRDAFDSV